MDADYSIARLAELGVLMELWEQYKKTVFLCHQRLALHLNFAIISAQNPAGQLLSSAANLRLDKQLQAKLQQQHVCYRSIIGTAPDFSFQEKSWVALCDKAQAEAIGEEFKQNAIFWVAQNQLYLVPILLAEPEVHLGPFHPRLVLLSA